MLTDVSSAPYVNLALYATENAGENDVFLFFGITEVAEGAAYRVDSEDADRMKSIMIGNSEALLIVNGGFAGAGWYVGNTLSDVCGNIPAEEVIGFAQGIRPL